jgi:hypothetical protein
MATGDITATIRPDGWTASLSVEGFTIGATYSFGMSGNNVPGANTPKFTVVSLGYDATGSATTITRTVYLTKVVRFPYATAYVTGSYITGTFVDGETITQAVSGATGIIVGNQSSGGRLYFKSITGTFNNVNICTGGTSGATFTSSSVITTPASGTSDEKPNTALTVLVALSDYVYQKDNTGGGNSGTAPTFTAPAGFIVNSGGGAQNSTVSTAAAVTQSSTAAYPKVVGNWSRPPFQRITGDFPLAAVAFHSSARNGKPVACVKFTAADTHSHTATTTVTDPSVDGTYGDAVPVVEYIGTMASSTLTALDVLTCNFIAYPWIGDSSSILDTSAGTAQPTPLYGPITMLNDKSSTYGVTCALVDPTGSDGGANTVYDVGSFNPSTAYKFLTIGKAAAAIASYNNTNHSRNDVGGGEVHLNDGNYNWTGSSNTYGGANASTWLTIKRASTSSARSAVVINGQSGDYAIRDKVKWYDITFTSAATFTVDTQTSFWTDKCSITSTGLVPVYQATVWYLTGCAVGNYTAGLQQFGTVNMSVALIRGCTFNGFLDNASVYTVIGNAKTDTTACYFRHYLTAGPPTPDNTVFAFNKLTSSNSGDSFVKLNSTITHGCAVVQNLFENVNNTQPLLSIGDDSTYTTVNNVLLWNNTMTGQRLNACYNDTGTTSVTRLYWSVRNNIYEDDNIKSDTFGTQNGNRIGNWSELYGAGYSGNFDAEVVGSNLGAGGDFQREFLGVNSYMPASLGGQPPTTDTNAITYVAFTNRLSRTQAGSGSGGGTYTLTSYSPAKAMQADFVMPFDLAGTARTSTDAAGAYHYASPANANLFLTFN